MAELYKSEAGKREVLEQYRKILGRWPVENRQYEVETRYGSTFVIESGSRDNPPLLLLHGSVSNSFTWYGDVAAYSTSYNVFAIDLIGEAGLSAPSRPSYDSGAYAQWLHDTMNSLGLHACSLVAMSLGGWMALDFATTYPDKVSKLVLLCPGGLAREKASFLWKALFYSLFGKWGQLRLSRLVGVSGSMEGVAFDFTSSTFKHFRPRTARMPLFRDSSLSRLKMPVYLLFGDSDQLIPANLSTERLRKSARHAKIELLTDTGHLILNQTDKIMGFLAHPHGNESSP